MSPTGRVALSGSAGALLGAFAGGLLALGGAAIAGQGPTTTTRRTAVLAGVALGAAAGAAGLGALVEHKELAAPSASSHTNSFPPAAVAGREA